MTDIRVEVDLTELRRALAQAPQETRRAARNAINDATVDAQKAIQDHVLRAFDVRQRTFILNSVKIRKEDRATTDHLEASVGIDPQRDLLAKFERGGAKVSIRGKQYVAVPSREIASTGGHVKRGYEFKRFQPFAPASSLTSVRRMGAQRVADRKPRLVGQHGTFFVDLSNGLPALAQTTKRGNRFRILYLFLRSVQLPPLLRFENIGATTVRLMWPVRTGQAIAHALRRAGLTVT